LIYEMLTGWAPFYEKDVQKMYQHKISKRIGVPDYVDKDARELLVKLLDRNPETRLTDPTIIKKHPWFAPIDWEQLFNKQIDPPYKPTVTTTDSTAMIDKYFTSKNIREEIGSADEPAIEDSSDPNFRNYSYRPEYDGETGSWPPRGKSTVGFDLEELKEHTYEPSKSQPGSYTNDESLLDSVQETTSNPKGKDDMTIIVSEINIDNI